MSISLRLTWNTSCIAILAWDNVDGFRERLIKLWEINEAIFSSSGAVWNIFKNGKFKGFKKAFSAFIVKGPAKAEVAVEADGTARAIIF